ncbi:MAG: copper amine oxidase N-terminal domain-containing protein, partial [Butyricicoccus sp.]|nr:copper amine oxidase N-terminal domain-containing protein [Butyricicoccus sp.]
MKRMKRLGALLLALCMLFSFAPVASAANGTIKMTLNSNTMTVNGTSVKIDSDSAIKPQVKTVNGAGYTMLPLRAVVEAMGGTVAYDSATKVITMTYGGNTLKHTIGTKTATVNGVSKSMSIASYAANNRTYVHLRAIELLSSSVKVNWTASAPNDVTITYPQTASNGPKTVNLTIKNSCATSYLQFTALQLAPAGSTTYSGNLLDGTLILGGTRVLNMQIQPGKYDLKGTDINGNNFYWKNLDFSQVKAAATLTLTSGNQFTLSVDSALTGNASSNVTVYNNTGATITRIQAFQ